MQTLQHVLLLFERFYFKKVENKRKKITPFESIYYKSQVYYTN